MSITSPDILPADSGAAPDDDSPLFCAVLTLPIAIQIAASKTGLAADRLRSGSGAGEIDAVAGGRIDGRD